MSLNFGFSLPAYVNRGGGDEPYLTGFLLQEDGFAILQEDGYKIIITALFSLAQEDGSLLLQENGSQIYA
jgi:hypothetical protein